MPTTITFTKNANWEKSFGMPGGMTGRWLKRQGKIVEVIAKAEVGKHTGKLQRSIKTDKVTKSGPNRLSVQVGSNVYYAYVHHEGGRAHIIRPKNGTALSWGGRRGFTVKEVRHPGNKANPYLRRGLNLMMRRHRG